MQSLYLLSNLTRMHMILSYLFRCNDGHHSRDHGHVNDDGEHDDDDGAPLRHAPQAGQGRVQGTLHAEIDGANSEGL